MKNSIRRYKIISGPFAGRVVEGFEIGVRAYPSQIDEGYLTHDQIMNLHKYNRDGFWYPEENIKIEFENHIEIGMVADYGNVHDLVINYDRYNQEIFVGDELFIASKNVVRRAVVTKIAQKVTMASNGVLIRKITVKDVDDGQTLTINESRDTIKIQKEAK